MNKAEIRDLILPKLVHDGCCRPGDCLCNAKDNTERIIDLLTDGWEDHRSIAGQFSLFMAERMLDDALNAFDGNVTAVGGPEQG